MFLWDTERIHLAVAENVGIQLRAQRYHWTLPISSWSTTWVFPRDIWNLWDCCTAPDKKASMDGTYLGRSRPSFPGPRQKKYCLPGVPFTSLWSMIKDIEIIYCGFVLYYHSLFINKNKNRYFLNITMF